MPISARSAKKESAAPVIELPQAKIMILEAELHPEPYEVTSKTGNTFTIDPNLNCQLQIVDDLSDGTHDGAKFYDSFKLKEELDREALMRGESGHTGNWTVRDGTKLGALAKAYYGSDFFETDTPFDEEDLIEFVFMSRVEPKKNFSTGKVTGSMLNWETIMAVPKPKKKNAPVQAVEPIDEEDFSAIPF
jgi:hypothetical protein